MTTARQIEQRLGNAYQQANRQYHQTTAAAQQRLHAARLHVEHAALDALHTTQRTAKGTIAGALGGLLAAWVMNRYREIESRPVSVRRHEEQLRSLHVEPSDETHVDVTHEEGAVKTAQAVAKKLLDKELTEDQAKAAGPVVHYAYAAAVGGLYGGLAELLPVVSIGMGIPYATVLFVAGDKVASPALGLATPPVKTSAASHASSLASHFAFGIALDVSRRILRRLL